MRVSSLPSLFACASSQADGEIDYDPPSDAGVAGSAVHEVLGEWVLGHECSLPAIARRYGVPLDELEYLTTQGRAAWDELRQHFPNPSIEHELGTGDLRGHCDIFSLAEDGSIAILDWKSSRLRRDYRPQLHGYALCAAQQYGVPSTPIRTYTVWLRLGEVEAYSVTAADLHAFAVDLGAARRRIGEVYTPGDACMYCRRQLACTARSQYVRSAVDALIPSSEADALVPPVGLPELYTRVQTVERACAQYRDALRMHLRTVGSADDGQGCMLTLDQRSRETIKPREAWPVLIDAGLTDDDLADCVTISIAKVGAVVADKAMRGHKGKAKTAVKQALRDAGAMATDTHEVLVRTAKESDK